MPVAQPIPGGIDRTRNGFDQFAHAVGDVWVTCNEQDPGHTSTVRTFRLTPTGVTLLSSAQPGLFAEGTPWNGYFTEVRLSRSSLDPAGVFLLAGARVNTGFHDGFYYAAMRIGLDGSITFGDPLPYDEATVAGPSGNNQFLPQISAWLTFDTPSGMQSQTLTVHPDLTLAIGPVVHISSSTHTSNELHLNTLPDGRMVYAGLGFNGLGQPTAIGAGFFDLDAGTADNSLLGIDVGLGAPFTPAFLDGWIAQDVTHGNNPIGAVALLGPDLRARASLPAGSYATWRDGSGRPFVVQDGSVTDGDPYTVWNDRLALAGRDLTHLPDWHDGDSAPRLAGFNSDGTALYGVWEPSGDPLVDVFEMWNLGAVEPHLRLTQRNDGRGTFAHPRLLASTSAPSSQQRAAAPRLGHNNRYR